MTSIPDSTVKVVLHFDELQTGNHGLHSSQSRSVRNSLSDPGQLHQSCHKEPSHEAEIRGVFDQEQDCTFIADSVQ